MACRVPLSSTISQTLLKLMTSESVIPSNHLILCRPLLLLASIFPSIRVFPNELALHIRRPRYRSCSFSISPPNEYSGLTLIYVTKMNSKHSGTSGTHSLMEKRSGKCMISYMVSDKGQMKRTFAQDTVRIQKRKFGLQQVKAQRVTLLCLESF